LESIRKLEENGYVVLPSVFDRTEIDIMRSDVLANLSRMGKTRSHAQSFHLAGFHRYPSLSKLHVTIASNGLVNANLAAFFRSENYYTIGLSDITINRSQQWHTDLLRGKYSDFLKGVDPWQSAGDTCIKALVYLQPGRSLRIVQGSHRLRTPLNDGDLAHLPDLVKAEQLELNSGDVVLMDIRAVHRGSTDAEASAPKPEHQWKILVSTVFGKINSPVAHGMQQGNLARNLDWEQNWLS
jgi:hypothetical protein